MDKEQIKQIKIKFTEFINQSDPWGLIGGGAPDDEYDVYINGIVSYVVNSHPSEEELKNKLLVTFYTNEYSLEDEKMRQLAGRLISFVKDKYDQNK